MTPAREIALHIAAEHEFFADAIGIDNIEVIVSEALGATDGSPSAAQIIEKLTAQLRDTASDGIDFGNKLAEARVEIARLKARLECDRVFVSDGAGKMVRMDQDVPEHMDGIACRDETIRLLEDHKEYLKGRIGEAYQIIGELAQRAGVFNDPAVILALDVFSDPSDRREVLPFIISGRHSQRVNFGCCRPHSRLVPARPPRRAGGNMSDVWDNAKANARPDCPQCHGEGKWCCMAGCGYTVSEKPVEPEET